MLYGVPRVHISPVASIVMHYTEASKEILQNDLLLHLLDTTWSVSENSDPVNRRLPVRWFTVLRTSYEYGVRSTEYSVYSIVRRVTQEKKKQIQQCGWYPPDMEDD